MDNELTVIYQSARFNTLPLKILTVQFKMQQSQPEKLPVSEALSTYSDVVSQPTQNAKAYILHSTHGYTRKQLCSEISVSNGGISRAKKALLHGFNPGRSGRRQNLSDKDEAILESWILELLDLGQTVYRFVLLEMVCTLF